MTAYHKSSFELLETIPYTIQKQDHIEFTHPSIAHKIISIVSKQPGFSPKTILEPGCGSGEFLHILQYFFPNAHIIGIDKNASIVNTIHRHFQPNVSIMQKNFFDMIQPSFDLIIGWIPFYPMLRMNISKSKQSMIHGKPNASIIYLLHALDLLEPNGIIAFILPAAFLTSMVYHNIRDIVYHYYHIVSIFPISYNKTKQQKQPKQTKQYVTLIIQKTPSQTNHLFSCIIRNNLVFHDSVKMETLKSLITHHTIASLDMNVKIGTIKWNDVKSCLTHNPKKTRLIYSSNLKQNMLVETPNKNPEKKPFINKPGIIDPVIIVSRGYGKGSFRINFCLVDQPKEFLVENHLMYIFCQQPIPRDEKLKQLQTVYQSLQDPRTNQFIELYFGKSAMNSSELKYILPLYTS